MNQIPPSGAMAGGIGLDSTFRDEDFAVVARIAHAEFGLHLPATKKELVHSRLAKRLRKLKLGSFNQYVSLLTSPEGEPEKVELLSALTTNVTSFFRENHHFETVKSVLLPDLIKRAKAGQRVRFWSAGCSAGQEPYSLALTLLESFPDAGSHDVRILATDIDPEILKKASTGLYTSEEIEGIPPALRSRYLIESGGKWGLKPEVHNLIRFGQLNLIGDWPMRGQFDGIFCRNVAIYFDKETQARLWLRFEELLGPGGILFIGHSERISGQAESRLESIGVTTYRSKSDQIRRVAGTKVDG